MLKGEWQLENIYIFQVSQNTIFMAGLLRLSYGKYVSSLTQEQLKQNQEVNLPINESAVMKAMLTAWIGEAVQEMNASKREKVQRCYAKIGLSNAQYALKRDERYEEAVKKKKALFPNMQDDNGSINEIDDLQPALELGVRKVTKVDTETGDETSFELEEDWDIENSQWNMLHNSLHHLELKKPKPGNIGSAEAAQAWGEFNMPCILIKM